MSVMRGIDIGDSRLFSLHITFADGSNPYVRYDMSEEGFAHELTRWNENYIFAVDDIVNKNGDMMTYITAYERSTCVNEDEVY